MSDDEIRECMTTAAVALQDASEEIMRRTMRTKKPTILGSLENARDFLAMARNERYIPAMTGKAPPPAPIPERPPRPPMIDQIANTIVANVTSAALNENRIHSGIMTLAFRGMVPRLFHEHRFPTNGRIDFYFPDSKIGLEVKVKGTTGAIVRQLYTYEEDSSIHGLILVTTRRLMIDQELFTKPFRQAVLFHK